MRDYVMYLRKSRSDSDTETVEQTLSRHRTRLDDLCRTMSIHCATVLQEVSSADSISGRPEMLRLLSLVEQGNIEAVVCIDMDRLSRGSGADQALVINTFKFAGTRIITPQKTYDFSNDSDEQFAEFGLMLGRAEYRAIKKRMWNGRLSAMREGKYVGGTAPYGYETYRLKGQKGYSLQIVPDQAEIVRRIYRMYTEEKLGYYLIAKALNDEGVPHEGRGRGIWQGTQIQHILTNPTYIGKIRYQHKVDRKELIQGQPVTVGQKLNRDNELLFDGLHSPIISREQFEKAQVIRQQNEIPHLKDKHGMVNPFQKVLRCGMCGGNIGMVANDRTLKPALHCQTPGCKCVGSYLPYIEEVFLQAVEDWLDDYDFAGETPSRAGELVALEREIKSLNKELKALDGRMARVYDSYETGVYDASVFITRRDAIEADRGRIKKSIEDINSCIDEIKAYEENRKTIIPKVRSITEHYKALTIPERNELLREVFDHIDYIKEKGGKSRAYNFELTLYPKIPK